MYTLGIDIGSTTSKCAVIKDGKELAAHSLQTGGLGTGGPEEAMAQLWQSCGLTRQDQPGPARIRKVPRPHVFRGTVHRPGIYAVLPVPL